MDLKSVVLGVGYFGLCSFGNTAGGGGSCTPKVRECTRNTRTNFCTSSGVLVGKSGGGRSHNPLI